MKRKFLSAVAAVCLFVGLQPEPAFANPQGGVVIGGDATATIGGEGTANVIINQFAENAVINWQDFSVQLGELTRFVQPGANAATLNRVLGGNPSQLLGSLQANGQIYLVNPNGILVGSQGSIDSQSFIASTLDISNESFLGRANMTFEGDSHAAIENYGSINALGGDIFLFAHQVKNEGTISALGGTVGLAAGNKIELRQVGNERIGVIIDNPTGEQTEVGVDNQGVVEAASAEIKAAGGNVYAVAINNGGEVRAEPKLVFEGGRMVIKSEGGSVVNSGTLTAANASGKGGSIDVIANSVTLTDTSHIDASGSQGGGDILVWGDTETFAQGTLAARGGSGAGGFVEVSSPITLSYGALTDTRADDGTAGTLFLDPGDFTISTGADNPAGGNVNNLVLAMNLGLGNVTLDTAVIGSGGMGDISVAAAVNWNSANSLTLTAG
ncbi:MAG: filamentous hemagglutinin family protein, partial [Candidatus Binatia bacterium]